MSMVSPEVSLDETQVPAPPKRPPAGIPGKTPVITARAIIRMQDVREDDHILDRNGTWRPVTKVHKRRGDTVRVTGRGHAGIELSDDHPVLVRNASGDRAPGWLGAGMLTNQHTWATPTHVDPLPIPAGAPETPEEWHLVGSYLRSGSINGDRITIKAADKQEAQGIRQHLAGWTGREDKGGGVTFEGRDQAQAKWLAEHFGDKPHTKTVPPWALGMDENHRRALLRGYYGPERKPLPTTSPELVTGMGVVAETLGERTDIKPILARWRPTYQARKLEDGHGSRRKHSWLGNQQARRAVRQRQVVDLEVDGGAGGSFIVGIGSMVISAAGEKPPPKPNARSRATAKPPVTTARNGGGGGGGNGRSAQSPASKPRSIPSVASIADALGHSVPVVGGRKPRPPQRDTVPLTPAQEQRVQQGIQSLDGVQREEAVANATAVPQPVASPRAQRAARAAENALFMRDGVETNASTLALDKEGRVVGVPSLEELRQVDRINGHEQGTAASVLAKQHGLVKESVPDVLAAERPAREQRVIRDFDDAQTISQLGKVTADWLGGADNLNHPGGYDEPADETAQIRDPLIQLNQAGYATYGSQPGHAPSVGWDGRTYEQRAAVDGFADREAADRIQAAAEAEGLTVIRHSGAGRSTDYSKDVDTTYADGQRVTSFGQRLSRSDLRLAMDGHMTDELSRAEQITVVDPEIGRNDRLERFAQRMDEQRKADPINDAWMVDDLNGLKPGTTENDMRRANGESVPDLRAELRTPAERQERAERMAAAEQVHAQDRERTVTGNVDREPVRLPLEQPEPAGAAPEMFDQFAQAGNGTAPQRTAQQTRTAQVDGKPVPVEIIDAPASSRPAVDSYGFTPGISAPPTRARLAEGDPKLRVEDIVSAARDRDAQAVDWDHIGAAMAGRAPMPKDQRELVGAHGGPALAETNAAVAAPISGGSPSARPAIRRELPEHRHDTDPDKSASSTPRPAVTATPPSPEAWNEIYAREAQIAAAARDRGLPIDHEAFERRLDEAWNRLHDEQSGADATPPERRRGRPQAGEHDLESTLAAMDRPREQNNIPPEKQRGLNPAGWREPPTLPPVDADTDDNKVVPERERGLLQAGEAGLRPPPTVNPTPTERPSHDPDVLERHGLADLARPAAADDTPAKAERKPQVEEREPDAKPAMDAEERATDRPTDDPSRDEDPISEDTQPDKRPEPKPDPQPERETVDRTAEPEPEPTPDPEPEREPRQSEREAAEAVEPAHSDPEPEAPNHYMGPEL